MLTTTKRVLTTLLATAGLVATGAMVDAASACTGRGCPTGGTSNSGQQVSVHVSGTFVSAGHGGTSGGTSTVTVYSPCSMSALLTGKELYDGFIEFGDAGHGPNGVESKPPAGWKKHKDDTKGQWYFPGCFADPDYEAFIDKYVFTPPMFVEAGQPPPVPEVPPEVLLEAAEKAMVIPKPTFDQNPHAKGANATIVKVPTWFWLDAGSAKQGTVTATAGNNTATVNMHLASVEYSSPLAGAVACADGGVAYSRGASSNCVLTFPREADAAAVTANSSWRGTWSFNGEPQGAVDPVNSTWQTALRVLEVQSLVTGVN